MSFPIFVFGSGFPAQKIRQVHQNKRSRLEGQDLNNFQYNLCFPVRIKSLQFLGNRSKEAGAQGAIYYTMIVT